MTVSTPIIVMFAAMLASVKSAAVLGVQAFEVTVEVDVTRGLPQWSIVGLAASSVKESRERVTSALANAGINLPARRVTVNLAPADIAKTGTAFDLPIAVAILVAYDIVPQDQVLGAVFLGELGLDGSVRPVRGVLPVARSIVINSNGDRSKRRTLVLPHDNVAEASLVRDVAMCAPRSIAELLEWFRGGQLPRAARVNSSTRQASTPTPDFVEVVAQRGAKRALEIVAAGGHNVLLVGPPGAGKTMLARRLPSILPTLTEEELLEVTTLHSVAGLLNGSGIATGRPFRSPHHPVSIAGLVGGGTTPRPGEVSLAHHGVLFLDELAEFPRPVLESLRQPLEDGRVVVSRAVSTAEYPARFMLVGAMNPCPCGWLGSASRQCGCSEGEVRMYRGRVSGPLLDRIDLHFQLTAVPLGQLADGAQPESSAAVRARVEEARVWQRARYRRTARCNAEASGRALSRTLDAAAKSLLSSAGERLGLSARAYHRVVRVSRTIADLAGVENIADVHVAEALRYRSHTPAEDAHDASATTRPKDRSSRPVTPHKPKTKTHHTVHQVSELPNDST